MQVLLCLGTENGELNQQFSNFLWIPVGTTDKSITALSVLMEASGSTGPYVALRVSSALRNKEGMSFEPQVWMSTPQEAVGPHEATVPWAERSITQQWYMVIHVTTHHPDTGEKIWQQPQPPTYGDTDENRPQKQAKMFLTLGRMMIQWQWEKALIVILFLISFHLKIILICECVCVSEWVFICVYTHACTTPNDISKAVLSQTERNESS